MSLDDVLKILDCYVEANTINYIRSNNWYDRDYLNTYITY